MNLRNADGRLLGLVLGRWRSFSLHVVAPSLSQVETDTIEARTVTAAGPRNLYTRSPGDKGAAVIPAAGERRLIPPGTTLANSPCSAPVSSNVARASASASL